MTIISVSLKITSEDRNYRIVEQEFSTWLDEHHDGGMLFIEKNLAEKYCMTQNDKGKRGMGGKKKLELVLN